MSKNTSARIAKLERQLNAQKPELNHVVFSIDEATPNLTIWEENLFHIAQGDDNRQRIGREIKVHRIDIEVYCQTNGVDLWVYKPFEVLDELEATDITPLAQPNSTINSNKFYIYKHHLFQGDNEVFKHTMKWKNGFPVYYSGSGATQLSNGGVTLGCVNYSGAGGPCHGYARVYYTDA